MKNVRTTLGASLLSIFMAQSLQAQPAGSFTEKQKAQQQRMIDCNIDAREKGLKAADYMAFMKTCLSGGTVTAEVGGASAAEDPREMTAGQAP